MDSYKVHTFHNGLACNRPLLRLSAAIPFLWAGISRFSWKAFNALKMIVCDGMASIVGRVRLFGRIRLYVRYIDIHN